MQTGQQVPFSLVLGHIWSDCFLFGTVRISIEGSTLTAKLVLSGFLQVGDCTSRVLFDAGSIDSDD
eukprot:3078059-Amphidinium_carterae.1